MHANYRIFSKYRLLARLGSGGMAEVFLAVTGSPGGFNKLQVLKVLRSDLPEQERRDFASMFRDEGRLAARLSHPNIVQSYEVGSEEGHDFIAMEFLEGQPLSHIQERTWQGGPEFGLEMQLQVLCCVLEGLEYAHTLRDYDGRGLHIVHRDVSPQNIFVTYSGHTKLVDFGIAKTLESHKTRAGVVKGKVPYMAPEQVLGGALDHRADLFSVGVILWEAIARRHMHGNAQVYELLRNVVQGMLPTLREVVPNVPPELERVVARALAHKPEDRYPDASSFRDDLSAFLETRPKVTSRDIGERVSTMFAAERREIGEVIRRAMSEVSTSEAEYQSGQINAVHLLPTLRSLATKASSAPTTSPITARRPEPSLVPQPAADGTRTSSAPAVRSTSGRPSAGETRNQKRWVVFAAVGSIALMATLIAVLSPKGSRSNSGSGAPLDTSASWGDAPKPATIRVRIHAFPPGAAMVLDGTPVTSNPLDIERARDGSTHTLEVSAADHQSRTLELRFSRDIDMEVRLAQAVRPENSASPAPRAVSRPVATTPQARAAPARSEDELYRDFPERKRGSSAAPPLDTSEAPW
jgi:eukaryotic-like serine/threonine-protein kinase